MLAKRSNQFKLLVFTVLTTVFIVSFPFWIAGGERNFLPQKGSLD